MTEQSRQVRNCTHTDKPVKARGLCGPCYKAALRRTGPLRPKNGNAPSLTCTTCKETKARDQFHKGKTQCKPCSKVASFEYWLHQPWPRRMLRGAYGKSRRALSLEYLLQLQASSPECRCCGVTMTFDVQEQGSMSPNAATLDRVVPSHGYVESNVQVVCWRCNTLKRNATAPDLRRLLHYVETYSRPAEPNAA